jgi:hypothetical protein
MTMLAGRRSRASAEGLAFGRQHDGAAFVVAIELFERVRQQADECRVKVVMGRPANQDLDDMAVARDLKGIWPLVEETAEEAVEEAVDEALGASCRWARFCG